MKNYFGFTLIELVIVIAIIGIISTLSLTAINSSRNNSKDARIIADLNQLKAIAESLYDNNYDAFNLNDSKVKVLSDDIRNFGGNLNLLILPSSNSQSYRIYSSLNNGKYYCINSEEFNGYLDNLPMPNTTSCIVCIGGAC